MKINVGGIDRILRVIFGLAMIAAAALGYIGWWGYIGVVLLITGTMQFCPIYRLLGFNTCPIPKRAGADEVK